MKMALTYLAPGSVSHDTVLETLQLFWVPRDLQCQKRLWIFFWDIKQNDCILRCCSSS